MHRRDNKPKLTCKPYTPPDPYQALWLACLTDALKRAKRGDERERTWIISNDMHTGSYMFICQILNLSPTRLRQHLHTEGLI